MDHGLRCSPAENDSFIHSLHLAGFPAHRRCNDEIVGREGGRLMAERIYARAGKGGLEPLEEEPFSNEDELQALIAEHPELLDGKQIRPDDPRRWVLVTREKGIAETADAGARWAIDHLIVDQDSVPTLAEVKRGSNPEIRRTVVGQMLRVIGRTTGHASPRGKLTRESFLEALPTKTAPRSRRPTPGRGGAARCLSDMGFGLCQRSGACGRQTCAALATVARLALPGSTMWGRRASDIAFTEGESLDYDAAAQHIDLLEDRLAKAVSELRLL